MSRRSTIRCTTVVVRGARFGKLHKTMSVGLVRSLQNQCVSWVMNPNTAEAWREAAVGFVGRGDGGVTGGGGADGVSRVISHRPTLPRRQVMGRNGRPATRRR